MKLASLVGVLLLLGFCAGTVLAAPGGDQDAKPWSYQFTPRAIIPELEPNDVCPGQEMACEDVISPAEIYVATDDDWYAFYVDAAGVLLTLGNRGYQGSSFDMYLELYDSCTGGYITYDDDSGPGTFSLISNFAAPHAGWYYAKNYGYGHYYTGMYEFFVTCAGGQEPPVNDTCDGAIRIPSCETGAVSDDLFPATNNYDPGSGGCASGYPEAGKDLTYVVDLTAGDIVHLVYTGSGYDAAFYIVTDCSNVAGTCVAGADAGYDVETINWTCTATGTYYIICDAYGTGSGGTYTMTYEITCPVDEFVCCVGHECFLFETEQQCADMQGHWHPEWDSCTGSPCDIYTPADPNSWGQIKNAYR
jgi:hypothetical protein